MKLLSEHPQMYGYEITQKVKHLTKGNLQIKEGALYPALHKLEAEGLLESKVKVVDNRVRKYYKITQKGEKETVQRVDEALTFINDLNLLLG